MNTEIIDVNNVSIKFTLTNDRIFSLKEIFTAKLSGKLSYTNFWALENIDFNIRKGEVFGIIGRNGCGKSTLLKIISGIMKPTKGSIVTRGNIVPMLELGSGFDMELSGRENIFLNGAVLGYSKAFLEAKFDKIVEFSELDYFINTPIRNYSSGMFMRLAFSIATMIEPEILIVDEILAVGDQSFQEKSKKRMLEMMHGGTTVILVSHSLPDIRGLCNRVLWLDAGKIKMIGNVDEVCNNYAI